VLRQLRIGLAVWGGLGVHDHVPHAVHLSLEGVDGPVRDLVCVADVEVGPVMIVK
jgi:hypothetical protein